MLEQIYVPSMVTCYMQLRPAYKIPCKYTYILTGVPAALPWYQ